MKNSPQTCPTCGNNRVAQGDYYGLGLYIYQCSCGQVYYTGSRRRRITAQQQHGLIPPGQLQLPMF